VDDHIGKANATVVVTAYNVTYDGDPRMATYTITGVGNRSWGSRDEHQRDRHDAHPGWDLQWRFVELLLLERRTAAGGIISSSGAFFFN
jgi:hypothetical protein